MSEKKLIRRLVLAVTVSAFCVSTGFAQPKGNPTVDPGQKPISIKKENNADEIFKKWLTEDVSYIITEPEIKAFKLLKTNEEREKFIADFWNKRDPDPETEENEFKDEFYERFVYANEHFTTGIPGWRTDRGRIYIIHGKPDSVESHPSGGSYDRPSYEGGGAITAYPFEVWFYRHLDNVGDGLEIEFVDPTGTGEYRLARDANEKNAMAHVTGSGLNINDDGRNYQRLQDTPFERLRINTDIFKAPRVSDISLRTLVNSPGPVFQNEDPIKFDLQVDFFRLADDRVITAFTVQSENKELSFKESGGLPTAQMNIVGKITSITGTRSRIFEESLSTNATPEELAQVKQRQSIYQKVVTLPPGTYKVDVALRDVNSGKTGVVRQGFVVPRYDAEKLATSTLILASRLYQTTEQDIGGRFVIGDKKVVPNLSGVYKKGQEVGVYLQVYNSGIDQTTLRPAVDVEYLLLKDGREVLKQTENWETLNSSGQRVTLARLIPTGELAPGNYEVKIRIRDRVNPRVLEPSGKFTIVQ